MSTPKTLTKRQLAVIEDLFAGDLEEPAVLARHNVKPALYDRWLSDERFVEAFERRLARSYRHSQVILARYASVAASKLVALTACEKEETARKACLDIIAMPEPSGRRAPGKTPQTQQAPSEVTLSPETTGRILAALAEAEPGEPLRPTDCVEDGCEGIGCGGFEG